MKQSAPLAHVASEWSLMAECGWLSKRYWKKKSLNMDIILTIEIINNTRGGIVMFFTEKKGNTFFGGQIQVPDAGPGADWLS